MSWLSRLYQSIVNRPDPAWAPTGFTYRHTGYDPSKLVQSATRAAITEQQRRLLAKKRGEPNPRKARIKKPTSNVVTLRRQA